MKDLKSHMLAQIDAALGLDWRKGHYAEFVATALSAIENVAGRDSAYARAASSEPARGAYTTPWQDKGAQLQGILHALHKAVRNDFLVTTTELIHGEVFGDYLDMAVHLVEQGYKDAAAVIGGSTLEAHLRQLCKRHSVDVEVQKGTELVPKKADTLNAELAARVAYSKGDQKSVTSWLDLRNNSAHGHYERYTEDMVKLFLQGIRDFITRNPA